ncbi:hypothetical protein ACIPYS_06465 [Kitasatospora sp. NPDC089913]|uniref:hypothetical protein n=1 Tax=Kitasatospora sp. NPDC089913 TaxID=3364080 RepID=UPI00381F8EBD
MPEFDHTTLALVDDIRDRERASDGHSRYGAYLAQHAHRFTDDGAPLSDVEFAAAAWQVATAPVMAPGYVRIRPDLLDLAPVLDPDGALHLRARVALRHHHLAQRPAGLADWQRNPWHDHEQWPVLGSPDATDRPALLITAEVCVPIPGHDLPRPTATRPGRTLTYEAQMATNNLVAYANFRLAPLVAELLGGGR